MGQFSSPPGATSLAAASFTLAKLAELTPELSGHERARLFYALPTPMQVHGLQELDRKIQERSARLWAAEQTNPGGETP